ncbi:dethiobiotin synthase [Methylacidimicrobium sp. B4]|uniref:dethiobiotin synthase n=1 Tax=Methylacidimicrobium sp. B4 TaxID=2796139 RepID=UPI001A8D6583|nr:dethiobiotin synthase [Methylacidimicrobium sp. B4]QSR84855.1 dethiobiotin synthase [Methylacidimicrobium sp. B4]
MQPEKRHHLFITGTDTHVGKTYCSAALLSLWRRLGLRPVGLKPIATGSRDDALCLQEAAGTRIPLSEITPFFFRSPAAPAIAAEAEGQKLTLPEVEARVRPLLARFSYAVVEGVGGWKTPLTSTETVCDLAVRLQLPVVIVALCRLGVLNHTLLTVESIRAAGLPSVGILLNGFSEPSEKTLAETAASLLRHAELPVVSLREASGLVSRPPDWLLRAVLPPDGGGNGASGRLSS